VSDDAARVQPLLDLIFSHPCACPARHAGTGRCTQKAETTTQAGAMCRPCAYCYTGQDWLGSQPLLAASMPLNRGGKLPGTPPGRASESEKRAQQRTG
jgi:hypothetical protein